MRVSSDAIRVEGDVVPLALLELRVALHRFRNERGQREQVGLHLHLARREPRQVEHVVDERREPRRLVEHYLHILRRHLAGDVAHDLGVAGDHRQRCTQIVRDVCDELLLHPVDLAQLRRRDVERFGKLVDLAKSPALEVSGVISGPEPLRLVVYLHHGTAEPPRDHDRQRRRNEKQYHRDHGELYPKRAHGRVDREYVAVDEDHQLTAVVFDDTDGNDHLSVLALGKIVFVEAEDHAVFLILRAVVITRKVRAVLLVVDQTERMLVRLDLERPLVVLYPVDRDAESRRLRYIENVRRKALGVPLRPRLGDAVLRGLHLAKHYRLIEAPEKNDLEHPEKRDGERAEKREIREYPQAHPGRAASSGDPASRLFGARLLFIRSCQSDTLPL